MKNKEKTVTIMGIPFLNTTKHEFLHEYLLPRIAEQNNTFVVTANPEIVMNAREDTVYQDVIQTADYVIPDGTGILMAAKYKKEPLQERIPGYELVLGLLEQAEENDFSCYFLGAADEVNTKAVEEVKKRYPNIKIAGRHHGFFDLDDPGVAEKVQQAKPDLVFVALGLPKQEKWIAKYRHQFSKGLFIGVGGSFDMLAGETKRAPKFMIALNLEWLHRLIKQPTRFKRILKVFEFMGRIILKKG